ncbi:MAG: hypothetical protein HOP18_01950, partial [Deltaproteobacteria bacterium]|nr:hypothetical protein [Deltaproteobacteria bacterium]
MFQEDSRISLGKREKAPMAGDPVLNFGSYRLDVGNEQLWRETQLVRLTPKAWQVLRLLVERSGQLVTKDEFAQTVWTGTVVSDAALTSCIQELRQALEDNARTPRYIETVHRRGFRFVGKVVSDQLSVVSQQGRSANKEEVGSVMPAQPVPSPYLGAGIQESQAEASANQKAKSENGLASSVQGLESENQISIPPPIQIPDGQLSVPVSLARQLWSRSRAILLSLLLLVGGSIAVHYLS